MREARDHKVRFAGILILLLLKLTVGAQTRAITPSSAPAPAEPHVPGIQTGDYLYLSGQGAGTPEGTVPTTFDAQVRQALENVKAIAEAAGLTMEHIVYTHVYLEDIEKFGEMNKVYAEYFPTAPPARATLGVAKLPGTPVQINGVAVRNLADKMAISVPGYDPGEPVSPGVLTHDRLFVSAMRGRDLSSGEIPEDPAAQVDLALDGLKAVLEAAGLGMSHMVFVNPYLTTQIPSRIMNTLYAQRFEFGNTPARATIQVPSLPEGAQIEYTGVAVRDLGQRRAVRPKNMRPSPTASPCVFAGDTLYCSAKSGFIPGPNGGIFASTVNHQLRQTMRNLLDNLEEANMDFSHVVAANIYLDDLADLPAINNVYAKYFSGPPPVGTTVQQVESRERIPDEEGRYPGLEQISLVAIRSTVEQEDKRTGIRAPYSVRRTAEVIQLEDVGHDTVVSIAPAVGNIAFEMRVKGHNILHWPYASVADFKLQPRLSGIPFLGPWADRLDEAAFYANGKRYSFDMSLGNVRGAMPSHGFLTTTDQWQVLEAGADDASAWVTSRLEFFRQPMWMKQFPFAHTIDMTYRLEDGVLQVTTRIRNMSGEPMPVAVGFHPYFRLTDSTRDEWTIAVGARTHWLMTAAKVPSGETEPIERLFPNPRRAVLDDYNLDDVFSDLERDAEGRATFSLMGRSQRIDVLLGPNFRAATIWAPHPANTGRGSQSLGSPPTAAGQPRRDRNFICFEPLAGIINALNLAARGSYEELQSIPPGGSWEASFWIRPSGF